MEKLEHAQTILKKTDLEKLKALTEESKTTNALAAAVDFTLKHWNDYIPGKEAKL